MVKKLLSLSPFGIDYLAINRVLSGIHMRMPGKLVYHLQSLTGYGDTSR